MFLDYRNQNVLLMQGDCLKRIPELEDDSVDCVITSPPYNMNLRIRNGKYCSRQIIKELSTKYQNFDDNLTVEAYHEFHSKLLREMLRVSPLVFYNVQFLTGNKRALFKMIGEFSDQLKEIIIWDKKVAQPAMHANVLNSQFEVILVFDRNNAISRLFDTAQFERGTLSNLWSIARGRNIYKTHSAVFPNDLVDTILDNFTVPGATILDTFLGTGTTGESCVFKKRKFIGMEIDPSYFMIAKERILAAQQNTPKLPALRRNEIEIPSTLPFPSEFRIMKYELASPILEL